MQNTYCNQIAQENRVYFFTVFSSVSSRQFVDREVRYSAFPIHLLLICIFYLSIYIFYLCHSYRKNSVHNSTKTCGSPLDHAASVFHNGITWPYERTKMNYGISVLNNASFLPTNALIQIPWKDSHQYKFTQITTIKILLER